MNSKLSEHYPRMGTVKFKKQKTTHAKTKTTRLNYFFYLWCVTCRTWMFLLLKLTFVSVLETTWIKYCCQTFFVILFWWSELKFVLLAGLPLKEKWEAFGLKLNHAHQQMKMTENALLFAFVEVFRDLHFDARRNKKYLKDFAISII